MFALHDLTRRRLCRRLFLLFVVAPTLAVGAWCLSRHVSGHTAALERELTAELGLRVELEDAEYLRPRVTLLKGLSLFDPETGQLLFRARRIEAGMSQGNLVLVASQPELNASRLDRIGQLLVRRLRGETPLAELPVRFVAAELTLASTDHEQTFTEIRGQIEQASSAAMASLSFRLAGVEMNEPARIRVGRNRGTSPPSSGFELHTEGAPLPCPLLLLPFGCADALGERSTFRGSLWAHEAPGGWESELSGELCGVDLRRVITDRFPQQLSGTADVTLQQLVIKGSRVDTAAGTLSAGPGQIGRALLSAAVDKLGLRPASGIDAITDPMPYEKLACGFVIDQQGLTLGGQCVAAPKGTVLMAHTAAILSEPAEPAARPVISLVQALVPHNELQVPATRETDWLLGVLPLPQLVPAAGAQETPTARLRVGRTQ